MKKLLAITLLAFSTLAAAPVTAQRAPAAPVQAPAAEPNEADLQTHDHYRNKAGKEVHSPSKSKTGTAPAGASAKCGDGTYSFSQNRRGTCSHHGGVATWL